MAGQGKTQQIGEVSRWGGWRGSPNSIAALLRCQVPRDQQRICKRCKCLAMRGYDHCAWHNGTRGRSDAAGRAESRLLRRMEYAGLLPLDLLALPVWRDLGALKRSERSPMRLALVTAWDKRERSPLYWAKVQREAVHLVKSPGRQAKRPGERGLPWFIENA
jgi:hypothetical protein